MWEGSDLWSSMISLGVVNIEYIIGQNQGPWEERAKQG